MNKKTLQYHAKRALQIQDACNLSGVASAFKEAMNTICEEDNRLRFGTEWRNHHPIVTVFLDKLTSLNGSMLPDNEEYRLAYKACYRLSVGLPHCSECGDVMCDEDIRFCPTCHKKQKGE